jgi:transposase
VWIATGHTDMRRGMNSLAVLVQEAFRRDPHGGRWCLKRGAYPPSPYAAQHQSRVEAEQVVAEIAKLAAAAEAA